jgi:uncharacterized damage-inducible protein DinB
MADVTPAAMDPFVYGIRLVLVRELTAFQREIEMFPDDELVWTAPPGISNSAGNLALHVAGNLQHFVGAILGGSGYVRTREREFSRRSGTRAELVQELARASEVVSRVLPGVPTEALSRTFPDRVYGIEVPTRLFLLHLVTHLAHHLGQTGYLRRVVTGESRVSGAIAVLELADKAADPV